MSTHNTGQQLCHTLHTAGERPLSRGRCSARAGRAPRAASEIESIEAARRPPAPPGARPRARAMRMLLRPSPRTDVTCATDVPTRRRRRPTHARSLGAGLARRRATAGFLAGPRESGPNFEYAAAADCAAGTAVAGSREQQQCARWALLRCRRPAALLHQRQSDRPADQHHDGR